MNSNLIAAKITKKKKNAILSLSKENNEILEMKSKNKPTEVKPKKPTKKEILSNYKMNRNIVNLKKKSFICLYKTLPKRFLVFHLLRIKNKKFNKIAYMFRNKLIYPDTKVSSRENKDKFGAIIISPLETYVVTFSYSARLCVRVYKIDYINKKRKLKRIYTFIDYAKIGNISIVLSTFLTF